MNQDRLAGLKQHSAESSALVRECLKTALLHLMRDRSYKDVSVSELCRKAGVSRMAFYRNYRVMNDLFLETATELNEKIIRVVGSPFRKGTTASWYERAFRIILEHREEAAIMFRENYQFEWMKVVNGLALHDPGFSTEKKYQRLIWCGGFENVVASWLNRGMMEPPEEMAGYCVRYLPHIVESDEERPEIRE